MEFMAAATNRVALPSARSARRLSLALIGASRIFRAAECSRAPAATAYLLCALARSEEAPVDPSVLPSSVSRPAVRSAAPPRVFPVFPSLLPYRLPLSRVFPFVFRRVSSPFTSLVSQPHLRVVTRVFSCLSLLYPLFFTDASISLSNVVPAFCFPSFYLVYSFRS